MTRVAARGHRRIEARLTHEEWVHIVARAKGFGSLERWLRAQLNLGPFPAERTPKRAHRCGSCGEVGHNALTCGAAS